MTIKQQYQKARKAYLSRVRYWRQRGYVIETRDIPKRITRASIRRLQSMTGDVIKRRSRGLQDFTTGMKVEKIDKLERARIEKQNLKFLSLTPEEQSVSHDVGEIVHLPEITEEILTPTQSYEDLIDKWYQQIEQYRPDIYRRVESATNKILEGADEDTRKKFAYVLDQNPDIFPQAEDSQENIIDMKMSAVLHVMNIAEGSEAYYDFLSQYDTVEEER